MKKRKEVAIIKTAKEVVFLITMMISAIENDFQREFMTRIYTDFYSVMFAKAKSLVPLAEDAEELVQDVFADLIKRVDCVMAVDSKKLPAYLISAVKYHAYNFNRHQKVKKSHSAEDYSEEDMELIADKNALPEDIVLRKEAVAELKSALEKIPEKYKDILEFKYVLGLSDSEIGERFGLSESGVRSLIFRARRKAYSVMKEGF
ncbi:MAG: sigma-70 family RNA polymerase sigma factor [Oscillospiraceae bacterium]|nr:sigma-70 family RNA polymerase sigma factor [Oscillospiraceae bacterium]